MILIDDKAQYIQIADLLRKEILAGNLHAGDKLEGEYKLAQKFHVGRQVIRSAIKKLKQENLLRTAKGSGVYIHEYVPVNSSAPPLRIGYVCYSKTLAENSFLESYPLLLQLSKEKNCEIYFFCDDNIPNLIEWVHNYKLDGLLVGGFVDDKLVKKLHKEKIFFLLMGNYELSEPCNMLGKDMFNNTKNAISILLKKYDFTSIGGIFSNLVYLGPRQALDGIRYAAKKYKIHLDEKLFLSADNGNGYKEMKKLLQKNRINEHTLLYLSDRTFAGAARAVFEQNLPLEKCPYFFLDKPISTIPYPELVGCFLYTENDIARQSLDIFLDLYHGRKQQFWQGYVSCKLNITDNHKNHTTIERNTP